MTHELTELVEGLEDPALRAHSSIALVWVISTSDPYWSANEWLDAAESAIGVFERTDDELGLGARTKSSGGRRTLGIASVHETVARKLAYEHAKLAGNPVMEMEFMAERTSGISWGPMPVSDGLALCHEVLELAPDNRTIRGDVLHKPRCSRRWRAIFRRRCVIYDESIAILRDLGGVVHLGFAAQAGWLIGWLSGDHQMAERETRWSCELLERTWREGPVRRQSRPDGAGDLRTGPPRRGGAVGRPGPRGERRPTPGISSPNGVGDTSSATSPRPEVNSKRPNACCGNRSGTRLRRIPPSSAPITNMDLADVLRRAGRSADAIPLLEEAVRLSELKEDVVTAGKASERLVALTSEGDTSA